MSRHGDPIDDRASVRARHHMIPNKPAELLTLPVAVDQVLQ